MRWKQVAEIEDLIRTFRFVLKPCDLSLSHVFIKDQSSTCSGKILTVAISLSIFVIHPVQSRPTTITHLISGIPNLRKADIHNTAEYFDLAWFRATPLASEPTIFQRNHHPPMPYPCHFYATTAQASGHRSE